ncbi:MAG: hypothetical protein ACYDAS_03670 [Patescibacteria group bacterium]
MSTTDYAKIQIPMKASLKKKAEKVASDYGYTSLQEVVRVFLAGFSKGDIHLTFSSPHADEYITPEFEAYLDKRLKETRKAIKDGTAYTIHSAKELTKLVEDFDNDK